MKRSIVNVVFKTATREYSYLTDLDLSEGDYVVVDTPNGFEVVKVVGTRGITSNQCAKASKWIVQKIDVTDYEAKKATRVIIQEIKNKLKQRKDDMEEIMLYKKLANTDPEIGALIKELESLDPSLVTSAIPEMPKAAIDKPVNEVK